MVQPYPIHGWYFIGLTHTNRALCLPVSYFHTLTHIVSQLLTIHTHKTNNSVVDRMTIFSEVMMNNHRRCSLCFQSPYPGRQPGDRP